MQQSNALAISTDLHLLFWDRLTHESKSSRLWCRFICMSQANEATAHHLGTAETLPDSPHQARRSSGITTVLLCVAGADCARPAPQL